MEINNFPNDALIANHAGWEEGAGGASLDLGALQPQCWVQQWRDKGALRGVEPPLHSRSGLLPCDLGPTESTGVLPAGVSYTVEVREGGALTAYMETCGGAGPSGSLKEGQERMAVGAPCVIRATFPALELFFWKRVTRVLLVHPRQRVPRAWGPCSRDSCPIKRHSLPIPIILELWSRWG